MINLPVTKFVSKFSLKSLRSARLCLSRTTLAVLLAFFARPTLAMADFGISFDGVRSHLKVTPAFVVAGQFFEFKVSEALAKTPEVSSGTLVKLSEKTWRWRAPSRGGIETIELQDSGDNGVRTLKFFVMETFPHKTGAIGAFRMGVYQKKAFKNNPRYAPPAGFFKVNDALKSEALSPNLRVGQFLSKQTSKPPHYLILQTRLVIKLEAVLEHLVQKGFPRNSLFIMSGFRTPFYNTSIGNKTTYSQHLYGGAADIFIDADKNGLMDDINKDGRVDRKDASTLAKWIEEVVAKPENADFKGGLSVYGPKLPARGPFVHTDVRGYKARW